MHVICAMSRAERGWFKGGHVWRWTSDYSEWCTSATSWHPASSLATIAAAALLARAVPSNGLSTVWPNMKLWIDCLTHSSGPKRTHTNVWCSPTSGCSCCYEITCILEPMAHCSKIFRTHTVYWSVLASCCLILFLYFSKPVSWNRPELFVYSPWTLQSGLALHPVCIHVFFHHCTDLGPISTVFYRLYVQTVLS